jgi:hypothetical protein
MYFFHSQITVLILTKIGWATFRAIISQTHLVTLPTIFMTTFQGPNSMSWVLHTYLYLYVGLASEYF